MEYQKSIEIGGRPSRTAKQIGTVTVLVGGLDGLLHRPAELTEAVVAQRFLSHVEHNRADFILDPDNTAPDGDELCTFFTSMKLGKRGACSLGFELVYTKNVDASGLPFRRLMEALGYTTEWIAASLRSRIIPEPT